MYFYRRIRFRPSYSYSDQPQERPRRRPLALLPISLIAGGIVLFFFASAFLKNISSRIAVSDAADAVTIQINKVIGEIMQQEDCSEDSFVRYEKNSQGAVTAISANMAEINALSARILDEVVGVTENNTITVRIPLGNLTGLNVLMGRGPDVPVKVIVLTSSRVEQNNEIVSAGINQIKHQITLSVIVDIDILIPWDTQTTEVVTNVLIADTVVVGEVPDTYLKVD